MDHFAGLDVSVKDTSVCIVDDAGKIAREVTNSVSIPSPPKAQLVTFLTGNRISRSMLPSGAKRVMREPPQWVDHR